MAVLVETIEVLQVGQRWEVPEACDFRLPCRPFHVRLRAPTPACGSTTAYLCTCLQAGNPGEREQRIASLTSQLAAASSQEHAAEQRAQALLVSVYFHALHVQYGSLLKHHACSPSNGMTFKAYACITEHRPTHTLWAAAAVTGRSPCCGACIWP